MEKENAGKEKEAAPFGRNIFLIGFMGSGKSTIAAALSEMYEIETVEMDSLIAEREGISISEIFARFGEEYFRGLETNLLKELQVKQNAVVSCGGGTPMREENVAAMKQNGTVVLLTASPDTIYQRVKNSHDRPLLENNKNIPYIAGLMERRREKYEAAADIIMETDGKDRLTVCKELVQKLLK